MTPPIDKHEVFLNALVLLVEGPGRENDRRYRTAYRRSVGNSVVDCIIDTFFLERVRRTGWSLARIANRATQIKRAIQAHLDADAEDELVPGVLDDAFLHLHRNGIDRATLRELCERWPSKAVAAFLEGAVTEFENRLRAESPDIYERYMNDHPPSAHKGAGQRVTKQQNRYWSDALDMGYIKLITWIEQEIADLTGQHAGDL